MTATTDTDSDETLLTTDKEQRERVFRERQSGGERMVHRLRDWEEGDILWGWASVKEGSSTGKTYRHATSDEREEHIGEYLEEAHTAAREAYEAVVENDGPMLGGGPGAAVFLFAARIESVDTEPPGPDPGEPPLKFAELGKVVVVDSHYESREESS